MATHPNIFLPEKFHGQRSLAGYNTWGSHRVDTTEQPSVHAHTSYIYAHSHTHTHILARTYTSVQQKHSVTQQRESATHIHTAPKQIQSGLKT